MSRKSPCVVCDEDQLNALNSIIQSPQYDKDYVLRAQIILQLKDGLQVKQVADNLHTNPITVRKWRDRFLDEGLDGLNNAPRPGRRGNHSESPEQRIREAQSELLLLNGEGTTSNSAEELSKRTGISTDVIYKLAREGKIRITPVRNTAWNIVADTDTVAKNTILEGLYISNATAMLVLSASAFSSVPAQAIGNVTTHSKDHATAMQKDASDQGIQSLLDLLFDAQKLNEHQHGSGKPVDPMSYLQQIAKRHSANAFTEYHAIVFSLQKSDEGKLTVPGIYIEYVDSMQDFLLLIKHFFNLLRKENRVNTPGWKVQERVQKLHTSMDDDSEPFIWTRTIPKQQTQLTMQMIYTDEDGESFIITVNPDSPIKKISDFNVSDLNGFRADVGDLEKALMDASNRLVGEGIKEIVNSASKKKRKTSDR